ATLHAQALSYNRNRSQASSNSGVLSRQLGPFPSGRRYHPFSSKRIEPHSRGKLLISRRACPSSFPLLAYLIESGQCSASDDAYSLQRFDRVRRNVRSRYPVLGKHC